MRSLLKSLVFTMSLAASSLIINSQTNHWQLIHSVAPRLVTSMGNTLIAGGNSGFYVSFNKGNSWVLRNGGFNNLEVYSIAMDGPDIYIGTGNFFGAAVLKSTDLGLNWSVVTPTNISGDDVRSMVIHNGDIYIGTRGLGTGGVYKSSLTTLSTQSWSMFNTGLTSKNIMDLAVCGTKIFAATECDGVFMSNTNTAGWGLSATNTVNPVSCYFQVTSSGGVLYAGGDSPLFRSTDCGGTWQKVTAVPANSRIIGIEVINNMVMVGFELGTGPQISNNAASSFTIFGNGLITNSQKNVGSFAMVDDTLFMGNYTGVWRLDTVLKPLVGTGLENTNWNSPAQFEVYPNPTSDKLSLRHNLAVSSEYTVRIFNGLGELVASKMVSEQETTFSTLNWQPQVYHMVVSDQSGNLVARSTFLIQR